MGVIFKNLDERKSKTANQGLPCGHHLSIEHFKNGLRGQSGATISLSPLGPHVPLSFSLILSHFNCDQVVPSSTSFVVVPSPKTNTCCTQRKPSRQRISACSLARDEQRWRLCRPLKSLLPSPFFLNSNAVQPLLPMRPPVLE